MALVLIEEVLMGLEEAKESLDQAVMILGELAEDVTPELGHNLKDIIETDLLQPLEQRAHRLDALMEEMAAVSS